MVRSEAQPARPVVDHTAHAVQGVQGQMRFFHLERILLAIAAESVACESRAVRTFDVDKWTETVVLEQKAEEGLLAGEEEKEEGARPLKSYASRSDRRLGCERLARTAEDNRYLGRSVVDVEAIEGEESGGRLLAPAISRQPYSRARVCRNRHLHSAPSAAVRGVRWWWKPLFPSLSFSVGIARLRRRFAFFSHPLLAKLLAHRLEAGQFPMLSPESSSDIHSDRRTKESVLRAAVGGLSNWSCSARLSHQSKLPIMWALKSWHASLVARPFRYGYKRSKMIVDLRFPMAAGIHGSRSRLLFVALPMLVLVASAQNRGNVSLLLEGSAAVERLQHQARWRSFCFLVTQQTRFDAHELPKLLMDLAD